MLVLYAHLPAASIVVSVYAAKSLTVHVAKSIPTQLCWHGGCRILDRGTRLELMHKTPVDGIPGAMTAFKGRLLAGVGPLLRLYDLGKKKLLRKCEYRQLPHHVASLHTIGSRIYAADVQVRLLATVQPQPACQMQCLLRAALLSLVLHEYVTAAALHVAPAAVNSNSLLLLQHTQ